jgi:PhnB protein
MANSVKPIPEGYSSLTPYISVKGAREALAFYKTALGAEELYRLEMPDGRIGHAELRIGDSRLMLAEEMQDMPDAVARSPGTLGGTTVGFHVYVVDVDAAFDRALAAGGTVKRPVQDQFYGDRSGTLLDPFGHAWTLATRIEDVSPDEMRVRMAKL